MLKPENDYPIPEETVKVAKAAFPNGNIYLTLRDTLGQIFEDDQFKDLYPTLGQPAESPGRLALITIDAVSRRLVRSTSRRSGAQSDRLEIHAGSQARRSRL